MNIEEFRADRKAKNERVAKLQQQVTTDKEKLKEAKKAYNAALVDGKDEEADKIFPELTSLKKQLESKTYKVDKLEKLNAEEIRKNAEETFRYLKTIHKEYEQKAKKLDDKMKPVQEEATKLLRESDKLNNEYREVRNRYFRVAEDYKIKNKNIGIPRHSDLEVFKETGVHVDGWGVVVQSSEATQTRKDRLEELPENASISDFAKANRIIGGE